MKTIPDIIVFVAWVAASLTVVSVVGHYRRTRAHVVGPAGRNEYRADRDIALQLIVFLIGVLSVVVIYALGRMVG
jgi:hypothetical protein